MLAVAVLPCCRFEVIIVVQPSLNEMDVECGGVRARLPERALDCFPLLWMLDFGLTFLDIACCERE